MKKNMDFEKVYLNKELCKIPLHKTKVIGYGLSSKVYRIDDKIFDSYDRINNSYDGKIIKEIYLRQDLKDSTKINELLINITITENPELKKLSIPFYSFDVCHKKYMTLLLEFDYGGKNLYEQLHIINAERLYHIISQVEKSIKVFNEYGITHNDLHSGNIFYDYKTNQVKIADWGTGKINDENFKYDDLHKLFYPSLLLDLKFTYYLRNTNESEVNRILKAIEYLKSIGKYKKYMLDVKNEISYQKKKFTYKPSSFLKELEKDIHIRFLKTYLSKTNFLIENSNIPEDILLFMDILR
jgi:serine/threonine protein kinase